MIPVLPSQLRALIPEANAPLCLVLTSFWRWAMQRQILRQYCFTSDGTGDLTLTANFQSDICTDIDLMGGCANLMSNPTPPPLSGTAFRALIPAATDALCLKTQPSIINFMEADTRDWEWMFTEANGVAKISESFRAALCTLGCLGGGGTASCPPFLSVLTLEPGNAKVTLHYDGQGINETGYEYEIYSAATLVLLDAAIAAGSGSALDTGTLTGATKTYEHTSLTNGNTYFYYMRVRKTACAWIGSLKPYAIPSECRIFNDLRLSIVPGADESRKLTIRVESGDGLGLPAGMTYEVWRSHTYLTLTESLGSGAIGDAAHDGVDSSGKPCLAFEHTDTSTGSNSWYFTVKLQEAVACSVLTVATPSGSPEHYPVPTGTITLDYPTAVTANGHTTALHVHGTISHPMAPANTYYGRPVLDIEYRDVNGVWHMVTQYDLFPLIGSGVFDGNIPMGTFGPAITLTGNPSPRYQLFCRLTARALDVSAEHGGNYSSTTFEAVFQFNP